MTCENCDPSLVKPGRVIKVNKDHKTCAECGEDISMYHSRYFEQLRSWDMYFHLICESIASKSPCLSRKIGAILVRDHSIISTGYNGPPRGVPHCGEERVDSDRLLATEGLKELGCRNITSEELFTICPRKLLFNYPSGEGMQWCPAQHAEENCVSNAARNGTNIFGSTLYMNCVIPCKNCFGTLINAGIIEIVVDEVTVYDKHTQFLIDNSGIKIRSFNI